MKKFELVAKRVEISYTDRDRIKEGCTMYSEPDIIERFDTLDEARKELEKYQTSIRELNNAVPYYSIEEYMIEANEYDENGNWTAGGDVLAISPMEWKNNILK
nr:MAG TPA: hypothetical protein [Caudoviricetes sp.]